jgi:hypothetical protein
MEDTKGLFISGDSRTIKFVYPLSIDWQPMPDITTFELAQAMPILISRSSIMPDQFDAYPESVKRHFKVL